VISAKLAGMITTFKKCVKRRRPASPRNELTSLSGRLAIDAEQRKETKKLGDLYESGARIDNFKGLCVSHRLPVNAYNEIHSKGINNLDAGRIKNNGLSLRVLFHLRKNAVAQLFYPACDKIGFRLQYKAVSV
jgi:hypothetical protein